LLFDREAVPQQDLDDATAERDRTVARVREMEIRLERSIIRAPIDGIAQNRLIEPGEVVAPGTRVTTLQRSDRLKVQANVPDTEIAWLARGRRAEVRVDAYPDRTFEARLSYLAPAADTQTRTFEVECDLPNPRRLLRPGMLARVELAKRTVEDGLVVPIDAVVQARAGLVAYVIEDCAARARPVVTGAAEGDRVLVEEGLRAGERLVVEGQRDLSDGQPVRGEGCP
jgi:membrane fusion protein (multidrug efflux system)